MGRSVSPSETLCSGAPSGVGAAVVSTCAPARALARPVLVDGLDAVGVGSPGRHGVVGVGGRGAARVRHQFGELALCVGIAVAPQDDVAGDAVVVGVVPGEGHRVVRDLGGESRGRRRRLGRGCSRGVDVEPARTLAHPVPVDGLDAVGVGSLSRHGVVGVAGGRAARVIHQLSELALGVGIAVAPQDDVAGNAVVVGIVPGQDHLVVRRRRRQPRGLVGYGS